MADIFTPPLSMSMLARRSHPGIRKNPDEQRVLPSESSLHARLAGRTERSSLAMRQESQEVAVPWPDNETVRAYERRSPASWGSAPLV